VRKQDFPNLQGSLSSRDELDVLDELDAFDDPVVVVVVCFVCFGPVSCPDVDEKIASDVQHCYDNISHHTCKEAFEV